MEIVYTRASVRTIDEVGQSLRRVAGEHGLTVVGNIDLREMMRDSGVSFDTGCLVFAVCNPHRTKDVLSRKMNVSTAMPSRIAVYEEDGVTKVSTILPTALLNAFHGTDLWHVARQIQQDIESIIDLAVTD